MRNFIWNGDVTKRNFKTTSWSRVCAPYKEGGLGVRSIQAANKAFLYKLAWEILTEKDESLSFILQRHTTADGSDVKYFIASLVWYGMKRVRERIRENMQWIPGYNSKVNFWFDN